MSCSELFVFIGAAPCTDWLVGTLALDSGGYVLTGADVATMANGQLDELGRAPLMLETSAPGMFAVGDVRSGSIKRVASAVGEGSMAGRRDPLPRQATGAAPLPIAGIQGLEANFQPLFSFVTGKR